MRKLILGLFLVGLLLAAVVGGTVLAAGPEPGSGPWEIVDVDPVDGIADRCDTKSGATGHLLRNTNSGKVHCFAD